MSLARLVVNCVQVSSFTVLSGVKYLSLLQYS